MPRGPHLLSAAAGAVATGALLLTLGFASSHQGDGGRPARHDAPKIPAPQVPGQPEELQVPPEFAAAMEFMTPGPEHEWLAKRVGTWTAKGRMWSVPEAPPTEFDGTSTYRMILGGRYLVEEMNSTMMGMPFEAMGITAFNRQTKQFQIVWLDTAGTGVTTGDGTRSADGNTLTLTLKMHDPMQGREVTMRAVETRHGDDAFTFEMYGPSPTGGEMKSLELKYARVK